MAAEQISTTSNLRTGRPPGVSEASAIDPKTAAKAALGPPVKGYKVTRSALSTHPLECVTLGHRLEREHASGRDLQFTLALPLHNWNGADRIRRRTINYLGADSEIDDRVPRHIYQAIDTSRLEKNAGLLTIDLFILVQLG